MMSILGALKTLDVPRLRIGVGEPQGNVDMGIGSSAGSSRPEGAVA